MEGEVAIAYATGTDLDLKAVLDGKKPRFSDLNPSHHPMVRDGGVS
jgi:hypothetical protein